uniref:Uncharacterized protein n=1 Tax=Arion vulgaris TaxID=1028688 RepID=A0A0B6Z8R8_9EUPU
MNSSSITELNMQIRKRQVQIFNGCRTNTYLIPRRSIVRREKKLRIAANEQEYCQEKATVSLKQTIHQCISTKMNFLEEVTLMLLLEHTRMITKHILIIIIDSS